MSMEIWFNPRCGTARKVRARLEESGRDVTVRDYLKQPPTRTEIEEVLRKSGMKASDLLRSKESLAGELGLRETDDESRILDAMAEHPILINRPVVIDGERARLCRPADDVEALLD